jgi:PAS domain S-box-containing protein
MQGIIKMPDTSSQQTPGTAVKNYGRKRRSRPKTFWASHSALAAALLFASGIVLSCWISILQHGVNVSNKRDQVTLEIDHIRNDLSRELYATINLTQGLVALVCAQGGMRQDQFNAIAAELKDRSTLIRNVALAPGNIIRFMYPLAGNEKALGLNYLDNPEQAGAVLRAIKEKRTIIAGPVRLVQDGIGIIGRTPIFLKDSVAGGKPQRYWGIAATVINFDSLIHTAGIEAAGAHLRIALRGTDGTGARGGVFWGDSSVFASDPVLMEIALPSGSWQMAAMPQQGWPAFNPFASASFLTGFFISLFFSMLLFQTLRISQGRALEISERKQVEEILRRRERQISLIYDTVGDSIFNLTVEKGGEYSFSSVNQCFLSTTGLKAGQIVGQRVQDVISEPSLSMVLEKYAEAIREKKVVRWEEVSEYPTGQLIGEVSIAPVFDDSNTCIGLVGSVHDITERKQAEEEIRKLNAKLEVRVAERTAELVVAKERAESADRLKSAFLATMSHELRTPLNSIIGFTGIILQGLVGEVTEEQRKQLNMVRDSAHHLLDLINDVLDISKIESGQLELRNEAFFLQEAIDKSIQVVRPMAEKKSLPISLAAAPFPLPKVYSDRRRVEQVLINLLGNAVKFTDCGGITLTVGRSDEPGRPDKSDAGGSLLLISITDTGIGIKAEDIEILFKPFKQIDSGTTRRYEGTGLGLSICKKLACMLGGDIDVQSDGPGKGSTFTFTLPAAGGNNG